MIGYEFPTGGYLIATDTAEAGTGLIAAPETTVMAVHEGHARPKKFYPPVLLISLQDGLENIGLKALHYYLLENGIRSKLLFLPNYAANGGGHMIRLENFIRELDPGLVGISLMSPQYDSARHLSSYLKLNLPSVPIVWGGVHPTVSPESCCEHADYVCIGEGERALLDVARAVGSCPEKMQQRLRKTKNLCYKADGVIRRNALYPMIEDLDGLPSYDHIPVNSYVQESNGDIRAVGMDALRKYDRHRGAVYGLISSRGCPFSCTYCCNGFFSKLYPKSVRKRGVGSMIEELQRAVADYPQIEYVNIQDDCFLSHDTESLAEFSTLYKEKVCRPFIVRGVPVYINADKIRMLRDAGMAWIVVGLHSGSDRACREVYNRKSFREDFLRASRIIKELGVAAFHDVILDNPFEDDEDRVKTIETLIDAPKPFYPRIFSLTLYPGTELYERAKEHCPHLVDGSPGKDYPRSGGALNKMARLAAFLGEESMRGLLSQYRANPSGLGFRLRLVLASISSAVLHEHVASFRVARLSQGGSLMKTFRAMPNFLSEGARRLAKHS